MVIKINILFLFSSFLVSAFEKTLYNKAMPITTIITRGLCRMRLNVSFVVLRWMSF